MGVVVVVEMEMEMELGAACGEECQVYWLGPWAGPIL